MGIFNIITDKLDSVRDGAEKRRALKEIEKQAFKRQKEADSQAAWDLAVQKAEEKGVRKAQMNTGQRIKESLTEKTTKIKAAQSSMANSRMSESMKGTIRATSNHSNKSFGAAVVGNPRTKKTIIGKK